MIKKLFLGLLQGINQSLGGVLQQMVNRKIGPILVKRDGENDISVTASIAKICDLQSRKDPSLLATSPKLIIIKFLEIIKDVDQQTQDTRRIAKDISSMLSNVLAIGNSSKKGRMKPIW